MLLFVGLVISLGACSPEMSTFTYTRISQQGATWESKETLQQIEDGLILNSESTGTCDTFKGEWHRENDTLVFRSSGDFPVTFIFASNDATIIWYDGMVTRLTNQL